jgi:hypothetical protein
MPIAAVSAQPRHHKILAADDPRVLVDGALVVLFTVANYTGGLIALGLACCAFHLHS